MLQKITLYNFTNPIYNDGFYFGFFRFSWI